ncbi:uncharacterized protein EHS24_003143 [Apiotrichum porosum]|uniref:Uncharacterized protein n=1 Tax=Apiotrichum porosum TaxID=105984 RepID=A0A427XFQ7_9TREE|nr:uncharacterized protein EHS24_003143 [Apiotrichum porosum]RSH77583.1 hypothetical protein EHS24_003143 [Apiotrichum porosum]
MVSLFGLDVEDMTEFTRNDENRDQVIFMHHLRLKADVEFGTDIGTEALVECVIERMLKRLT